MGLPIGAIFATCKSGKADSQMSYTTMPQYVVLPAYPSFTGWYVLTPREGVVIATPCEGDSAQEIVLTGNLDRACVNPRLCDGTPWQGTCAVYGEWTDCHVMDTCNLARIHNNDTGEMFVYAPVQDGQSIDPYISYVWESVEFGPYVGMPSDMGNVSLREDRCLGVCLYKLVSMREVECNEDGSFYYTKTKHYAFSCDEQDIDKYDANTLCLWEYRHATGVFPVVANRYQISSRRAHPAQDGEFSLVGVLVGTSGESQWYVPRRTTWDLVPLNEAIEIQDGPQGSRIYVVQRDGRTYLADCGWSPRSGQAKTASLMIPGFPNKHTAIAYARNYIRTR